MGASAAFNVFIELGGTPTAFSAEATVNDRLNYWRIADDAKNMVDPREAVTVEVSEDAGGTWETLGAGEYMMLWLVGVVDIDDYTSLSGDVANIDQVRMSGTYVPRHRIIGGHNHTTELSKAELDSTQYGNAGMARLHGLADISGTFEVRNVSETPIDGDAAQEDSLEDFFESGGHVFYSYDPTGDQDLLVRGTVKLFGHNISSAVADLVDKSLAYQGANVDSAMADQPASVAYLYER